MRIRCGLEERVLKNDASDSKNKFTYTTPTIPRRADGACRAMVVFAVLMLRTRADVAGYVKPWKEGVA